jgi:hypothetical protein
MSMMNMFVLTSAQRTASMGLDSDANAAIDPRAVDNTSPGVGLNLNASATGVLPGAVVTLVGCYVAPKRIVDDPDYQHYCPNLVAYLLTLPFCSVETETIFAPSV